MAAAPAMAANTTQAPAWWPLRPPSPFAANTDAATASTTPRRPAQLVLHVERRDELERHVRTLEQHRREVRRGEPRPPEDPERDERRRPHYAAIEDAGDELPVGLLRGNQELTVDLVLATGASIVGAAAGPASRPGEHCV